MPLQVLLQGVLFWPTFSFGKTRDKNRRHAALVPRKSPQQSFRTLSRGVIFFHFLIISFYQATLRLVLGDKQRVKVEKNKLVMLRISRRKQLFFCYLTRELQKMGKQKTSVRGDKVWHGNQLLNLSSRNLQKYIYFYYLSVQIFSVWVQRCAFFFTLLNFVVAEIVDAALKFCSLLSSNRLADYPAERSRRAGFRAASVCSLPLPQGHILCINCSFCGNLVRLGGRMWARVHYSSDSFLL